VKNGQSIDVIINTNHLPISTATTYRYIENRYIEGIRNIDLKRKVKYATRTKAIPKPIPMNYDFLADRRFIDFTQLLAANSYSNNVWEMDTVIGKITDEKCLLTLLHRTSNLQLIFLLKNKTMYEVNHVFTKIKKYLGDELFKDIFSIILTDNGAEFHDPLSLETSLITGEQLIHIYFCEPRRSDQKGKCEKNHEHIRDIISKGTSMDALSSKEIRYVSRMINNYPRAQFNYHSPYEVISKMVNKKVLELNDIAFVPSNQIILKPLTK
ncbi:MAG: IS30 family transposase, partial [Erysipelotrichaceae bacterium]